MNGRSSTFDFGFRFTLQAMCNNAGRWNMSQLDHAGFAGRDPLHAVTFVENHDTDLNSPVVFEQNTRICLFADLGRISVRLLQRLFDR